MWAPNSVLLSGCRMSDCSLRMLGFKQNKSLNAGCEVLPTSGVGYLCVLKASDFIKHKITAFFFL